VLQPTSWLTGQCAGPTHGRQVKRVIVQQAQTNGRTVARGAPKPPHAIRLPSHLYGMIHPDFGCGTRCYRHDLLHKSLAVAASLTQLWSLTQLLASATTCYRHYMLQALPVTQVLGSSTRSHTTPSDTTPVPPCRIRSKDLTIVWDLTCNVQCAMKHGEYCINLLGASSCRCGDYQQDVSCEVLQFCDKV